MILGSHHENLLQSLNNESKPTLGLNNFPANKNAKFIYDTNRPFEQKHIYLKLNVEFEKNTLLGTCYILFEAKLKLNVK